MIWIRQNLKIAVPVAVGLAAVVAYLAFGVFGVHTLFIDDVANESGPVFDSGLGGDDVGEDVLADMDEAMVADDTPTTVEAQESMPMSDAEAAGEIVTLASGSFIGRSHPAEGQALVLNDGSEQRFLRFEDFATDNGPDLNVYLVADTSADGDSGTFDDDFVDLGDLTGNIGPQNYEIPTGVDLDRYNTVVIWCVRFGVAFGAADLLP